MLSLLDSLYAALWSVPVLALITGLGLYYTIALRGIQFRYLGYGLRLAFSNQHKAGEKGDISHFQSLMTALAATIGIGNIAGVATALTMGGVGALFWMWITAFLGMATKYSEALLAVKYREKDHRGEMSGGPMYFIDRGLGWKRLGASFAFFGAVAALGGGNMIQANSVTDIISSSYGVDPVVSAVVLAALVGLTLLGGIKSIGQVTSVIVPFMAIFYLGGGLIIIGSYIERVPEALMNIVTCAFSGQAAVGGFAGSTIAVALQSGISRGLMTSEAGLGTASIAAAAATTDCPGRQALVSMTGSFLATIVMCTVTGLVLTVTNAFGMVDAGGQMVNGATLTLRAFESVYPWAGSIVTIGCVLFAFTTLLGWAYYGEKCVEYLVGEWAVPWYRALFSLVVIPGGLMELALVWKISDITNALMALPNMIGLCALAPVVVAETRSFLMQLDAEEGVVNSDPELASV